MTGSTGPMNLLIRSARTFVESRLSFLYSLLAETKPRKFQQVKKSSMYQARIACPWISYLCFIASIFRSHKWCWYGDLSFTWNLFRFCCTYCELYDQCTVNSSRKSHKKWFIKVLAFNELISIKFVLTLKNGPTCFNFNYLHEKL